MTAVATDPQVETQKAQTTSAIEPQKTETALAPQGKKSGLITHDESEFANLLDTARFEHIWRVAQMFAKSKIVPSHFQNEPENCFIAVQMAVRLGVDPFMFMQKTYVVQGKPGMEAQLAIALVNSRGPFTGPIQWTMTGEGMSRSATAFAVHRTTGQRCECTVTMKIANDEGWLGKSGSKWKTMPDQMLRYRSAAWLARLYAPECLMGMETADELEDHTRFIEATVRPAGTTALNKMIADGTTGAAVMETATNDVAEPVTAPAAESPAPDKTPEQPKAEAPAPTAPTSGGEPSPWEQAITRLTEVQECSAADAEKKLRTTIKNLYSCDDPAKMKDANWKLLMTQISSGAIKVGKK